MSRKFEHRRYVTWECLENLDRLGASTWFKLGDRDLATHLWRRAELASGKRLSQVTQILAPPILDERTLMRTLKDRVFLADARMSAADELNEAVRCRLA